MSTSVPTTLKSEEELQFERYLKLEKLKEKPSLLDSITSLTTLLGSERVRKFPYVVKDMNLNKPILGSCKQFMDVCKQSPDQCAYGPLGWKILQLLNQQSPAVHKRIYKWIEDTIQKQCITATPSYLPDINTGWLDVNVIIAMQCLLRTQFQDTYIPDLLSTTNAIQNILTPVKTIVQRGTVKIDLVQFKGQNMVLKTQFPTNVYIDVNNPVGMGEAYAANLSHEILIGYILNTLRGLTPCFAYQFAGIVCTSPDGSQPCFDPMQSQVVAMSATEYCGTETLKSFLERMNPITPASLFDVYTIMFQLAHALFIAQQPFRFQHLDLKSDNIMIRPNTNRQSFVIHNKEFVPNYIPQIIDFGFSTVVLNNHLLTSLHDCVGEEMDANSDFRLFRRLVDGVFLSSFDIYRLWFNCVPDLFRNKIVHITQAENQEFVNSMMSIFLIQPKFLSFLIQYPNVRYIVERGFYHGMSNSQLMSVLDDIQVRTWQTSAYHEDMYDVDMAQYLNFLTKGEYGQKYLRDVLMP